MINVGLAKYSPTGLIMLISTLFSDVHGKNIQSNFTPSTLGTIKC